MKLIDVGESRKRERWSKFFCANTFRAN